MLILVPSETPSTFCMLIIMMTIIGGSCIESNIQKRDSCFQRDGERHDELRDRQRDGLKVAFICYQNSYDKKTIIIMVHDENEDTLQVFNFTTIFVQFSLRCGLIQNTHITTLTQPNHQHPIIYMIAAYLENLGEMKADILDCK